MKSIKRIILGLIISMICLVTVSEANSYSHVRGNAWQNVKVGDTVRLTMSDLNQDDWLFCADHNAVHVAGNHRVVAIAEIKGDELWLNGRSLGHNSANAAFAYIASEPVRYRGNKYSRGNAGGNARDPKSYAVWDYGPQWLNAVYGQGLKSKWFTWSRKNLGPGKGIVNRAKQYASSYKGGNNGGVSDSTGTPKVVSTSGNYVKIGPYKWNFAGYSLTGIKVYDEKNREISGIKYSNVNSGKDFYIEVPMNGTFSKISKVEGSFNGGTYCTAKVWFLDNTRGSAQNKVALTGTRQPNNQKISTNKEIPITFNVDIIKENKDDTRVKLNGVSFHIRNTQLGWVQKSGNSIKYVQNENQATTFITGKDSRDGKTKGQIHIDGLIAGTYTAHELSNPNYGYPVEQNETFTKTFMGGSYQWHEANKQKWIKLSGYVWTDDIAGKDDHRNDLYKDNDYDSEDKLMEGIPVRVIDKTTGQVAKDRNGKALETTTGKNGSYLFGDVLISELDKYSIEFEYDGLKYTNVVPHTDKDNGSKAKESEATRTEFNSKFSKVEGKDGSLDKGQTLDANNNVSHNLSYTIDSKNHKSDLIHDNQYQITANTSETGYNIRSHFQWGMEEVKNNNLGLYEREQPDMALMKDIQSVRTTINGYEHIYEYNQRKLNAAEYGGEGFNVGVKFGEKYSKLKYSRAVYKADYEYENPNNASKELKVYITYCISLRNNSETLISHINNVVDYYDSNYNIVKVGNKSDGKTITGDLEFKDSDYNDKYKKTIINTDVSIQPEDTADIYVEFELNRQAVIKVLNNKENLDNVAEINSYTILDKEGKLYAGIDSNSNPGNVVPGDENTYQDDSDVAPSLLLEVADARTMSGKVFLDSTSGELMTGKIRQGNGQYDEGEQGIKGVKVTLTETTGSGKVYEVETYDNGEYYIDNYIPGDYTLSFTWGDKTYTVQKYKGTIYDSSRNQSDKQWFKKDVDKQLTDAIDDYGTRQEIDNEIKNVRYDTSSKTTIHEMTSTTPVMGLGVEYDSTYTASTGDRYEYPVKNVDFGIVERARQQLGLSKRVKSVKVTLANGQVISDMTIDENGNPSGERSNVIYMKPGGSGTTKNGFVRVELDNELLEGSKLEVTYEIKATNESELDYLSEDYYKYGIQKGDVVTITPSAIIDYLDGNWAYENTDTWLNYNVEKLKDKDLVASTVYNNEDSKINSKFILYTTALKDKALKPTESASVDLNVSKLLSSTGDISLDNEAEIDELDKTGGSLTTHTPGNYIPGSLLLDGKPTEPDDAVAENVTVTPATGGNKNYIVPGIIIAVALVVLGGGVILIKKRALGKDDKQDK